jgi:hypothetical protein
LLISAVIAAFFGHMFSWMSFSVADPGLERAHLKKLCRAEGDAKCFRVFRVKNHDITPKNHIFSNFRGARRVRPPPPPLDRPCYLEISLAPCACCLSYYWHCYTSCLSCFSFSFVFKCQFTAKVCQWLALGLSFLMFPLPIKLAATIWLKYLGKLH